MEKPKPIVQSLKNIKPLSEEKKKQRQEEADKALLGGQQQCIKLPSHPAYQIINSIQTCIGEIGQFLPGPDYLPNHPAVAFFGKRRTGKSFGLRWLMYKCFRNYPFGSS